MKATGWALLVSAVALAAPPARAQTATLPEVPELKLEFPIQPLRFSFTGAEVGSSTATPLRLFRAESLWLATPRLKLLTFTAAERAFELDCRLTCQPVVQTVVALEARFLLPSPVPAVKDAHLFLRATSTQSPTTRQRPSLIFGGLAGAF
jgi:hypothetical protein